MNIPETKIIPIKEIKEDEENPNEMTAEELGALLQNIKKYGFLIPIITNKEGIIADGHQRLTVAKKLGMKEVPTIKLDVNEVDRKTIQQVMNKLKGTHNNKKDAAILEYLQSRGELETLAQLLAKNTQELLNIIRQSKDPEKDYIKFDQEPIPPKTKMGELWTLGEHKLIIGDSTKPETMKKLMGTEKAQLILTDPPYNLNHNDTNDKHGVMANDHMKEEEYQTFINTLIKNANKHTTKNPSIYVCIDWRQGHTIRQAIINQGYNIKNRITWAKDFGGLGQHYRFSHEDIWFGTTKNHIFHGKGIEEDFWKLTKTHSNEEPIILTTQGTLIPTAGGTYIKIGKTNTKTKRIPIQEIMKEYHFKIKNDELTDTWYFSSQNSFTERQEQDNPGNLHATIKPVPLMTRAIQNSTNPGDIIIDFCGGSGSTLIAAERTKRKARIIEINPEYADVIIHRYEKLTGNKATKEITE